MKNKILSVALTAIKQKFWLVIAGLALVILAVVALVFFYQFSAPQGNAELEQFTVIVGNDDSREVAQALYDQGFIKSELGFKLAFFGIRGLGSIVCIDCIQPGAYKISKSMNTFQAVSILKKGPYMKWVSFPEGWRKEQIAELLAQVLNWNNDEKQKWVTDYTAMKYDYVEGVYFPDTYLIPVDESPLEVAERMQSRFEENFAPYAQEALNQNIKWDTVVRIASLIQREAGGKDDMPMIAGIIWNRLLQGMKLEIDATLQYARDSELAFDDLCKDPGNVEPYPCQCDQSDNCYLRQGFYKGLDSWWQPITPAEKQIDSPYNTYLNQGLPPHPIVNPGIDAIKAVLYPEETDCLFYLHDSDRIIHCSPTYAGHQENIEKYLR